MQACKKSFFKKKTARALSQGLVGLGSIFCFVFLGFFFGGGVIYPEEYHKIKDKKRAPRSTVIRILIAAARYRDMVREKQEF